MRLLRAMAVAVTLASALPAWSNPLVPLDTSSPRATYDSFVTTAQALEKAVNDYRADPTRAGQRHIRELLAPARGLFDLSEVAPATRLEIGGASFAYLHDVLVRLPPVDLASIPGGVTFDSDTGPDHWIMPGTEIRIALVGEGENAGDYLFSPETVSRLPEYYARIIERPVIQESALASWRDAQVQFAGPLLHATIAERIPEPLQRLVFGSPAWKVILVVLAYAAAAAATLAWQRLVRSLARDSSGVRRGTLFLTVPLVLIGLVFLAHEFVLLEVHLSGRFAEAEALFVSALRYAAAAWAVWAGTFLVAETIIASPAIPDQSYDAHLLRLVARVLAILGGASVIVYGANDVGIPALGLVAGLGVGGFALALAAQSTVENLIGGFSLFADRPFRVGDFVAYGDAKGIVEAIGPRSSRIRGLDGTLTTVPNGDLAKMHITNYSKRNKCLFHHVIGVRYETSSEQLQWLARELPRRVSSVDLVEQTDDHPRVRVVGFGASSIDIEVRAHVLTTNYSLFLEVQERILLAIMRTVEEAGSGFAFPSQTTYLANDGGLDEAIADRITTKMTRRYEAPLKDREGSAAGEIHGYEHEDARS